MRGGGRRENKGWRRQNQTLTCEDAQSPGESIVRAAGASSALTDQDLLLSAERIAL